MRFIILAMCLMFTAPVSAGFFTGVMVGSAMGNNNNAVQQASSNALYASNQPNRDVVVCCTSARTNKLMCEDVRVENKNTATINMTPAQFTKLAGYDILYQRGFVRTSSGCDLIIMEVGKGAK